MQAHTELRSSGALEKCHRQISLAFTMYWRGGIPWSGDMVSELPWCRRRKCQSIAFFEPEKQGFKIQDSRCPRGYGYQCAHVAWFPRELVHFSQIKTKWGWHWRHIMTYMEVILEEVSIDGVASIFSHQGFKRARDLFSHHIFFYSTNLVVHF